MAIKRIWLAIGAMWAFETAVFIGIVMLPFIGVGETSSFAEPATAKVLFAMIFALNVALTLACAWPWLAMHVFEKEHNRTERAWHLGLAAFVWLWPTIGAFEWSDMHESEGEDPIAKAIETGVVSQAYISWMKVLVLAAIAAITVTVSATILVRAHYTSRRRRHAVDAQIANLHTMVFHLRTTLNDISRHLS